MSKQIYVNLIIKDLAKSSEFYKALGFTKNETFSSDDAASFMFSDDIVFMLLTEEFAKNFNDGKSFADQKKTVSAFYALGCASKKDVDKMCEAARSAGGRVYENEFNKSVASDFMYSFEIEDPDGYILEPVFMDMLSFHKNKYLI